MKFSDSAIAEATARELGLEVTRGSITMFDGKIVVGLGIKLPNWYQPVAIDEKTGETFTDNMNGHWGKQCELDKFTKHYAKNKATAEARRMGWMVQQTVLKNGQIKLTCTGM